MKTIIEWKAGAKETRLDAAPSIDPAEGEFCLVSADSEVLSDTFRTDEVNRIIFEPAEIEQDAPDMDDVTERPEAD